MEALRTEAEKRAQLSGPIERDSFSAGERLVRESNSESLADSGKVCIRSAGRRPVVTPLYPTGRPAEEETCFPTGTPRGHRVYRLGLSVAIEGSPKSAGATPSEENG